LNIFLWRNFSWSGHMHETCYLYIIPFTEFNVNAHPRLRVGGTSV
jgi:hypothetical protein